jgi:hypothetical protein
MSSVTVPSSETRTLYYKTYIDAIGRASSGTSSRNLHVGSRLYIAIKNALPTGGNINHLPQDCFWEAYWDMGLEKDASLIAQVLEGWLYLIYFVCPIHSLHVRRRKLR